MAQTSETVSHEAPAVFFDHRIQPQFFDIIESARRSVIFVTPYVGLWPNLKRVLSKAVNRGVAITFVIREEQKHRNPDDRRRFDEDMRWLEDSNVKVHRVSHLHAKIYLNEEKVLVSSMNVLRSSIDDSIEFAMVVNREIDKKMLIDYVSELIPKSTSAQSTRSTTGLVPGLPARTAIAGASNPAKLQAKTGHCIRCDRTIPFNKSRPYCVDDARQWRSKDLRNLSHPETYCHTCGNANGIITFAAPQCWDCWGELIESLKKARIRTSDG